MITSTVSYFRKAGPVNSNAEQVCGKSMLGDGPEGTALRSPGWEHCVTVGATLGSGV